MKARTLGPLFLFSVVFPMLVIATEQNPEAQQLIAKAKALVNQADGGPQAMLYLDEAFKLDPNNPNVHYYRGLIYQRLGDYQQAVHSLRRAIQLQPDPLLRAFAYDNIGTIFLVQKKYNESIEAYQESVKLEPEKNPISHYNLAKIYLIKGEKQKAEQEYAFLKTNYPEYAIGLASKFKDSDSSS